MFLQEIRCFIAVAECLNFTAAANKLYISQPGLSKTISNLEKELNARLFIRSTRSVRLTKAGEEFLVFCREFLGRCESLNIESLKDNIGLAGSLTIGMGDMEENRYLPQIIGEFTARYPMCNLSIRHYTPEELLGALDIGSVDFGVMVSTAVPAKGYQKLLYYPSRLMLVVPAFHRLADREKVHISELKDENFLTITRTANRSVAYIHEICAKGNFTPKFMKETNSLNTMFMLIVAGTGISLSFRLHKDTCNYNLRWIELDTGEEEAFTEGGAFVWHGKNSNPLLRPFAEHISDCAPRFRREMIGLDH